MTAKTSTRGDLPPIPFRSVQWIPAPDAVELPFDSAWQAWDEAVRQQDEAERRRVAVNQGEGTSC